jgi:hypothetical protein
MRYYIVETGRKITHELLLKDTHILGESNGLGSFWSSSGYTKFMEIAKKAPDLLDKIDIFDDKGKQFTANEFVDLLTSFKRVHIQ